MADATAGGETAAPGLLDEMVEATPEGRDRYVDFLRAFSILVVVLYHWVFTIVYWSDARLVDTNPIGVIPFAWAATWLLQVMPIFFFVGGFSNSTTWASFKRKGDGYFVFLRGRLLRLLKPVVVFLGVWIIADQLLRRLYSPYPGIPRFGLLPFTPLWFIGVYLLMIVFAPLMYELHVRWREVVLVVLCGCAALMDLVRFRYGLTGLAYANLAFVWLFVHQLGYFWADGSLLRLTRRSYAAIVLGALFALVALTNSGIYPLSMVATAGQRVSNMNPPTIAIAATGVLQLGLAMLAKPALDRWLRRKRSWKAVVAANAVIMTVFVWHMTAYMMALALMTKFGLPLLGEATVGWWAQRPLWVLVPALFLVPLVLVFSRVELPKRAKAPGG